LGVKDKENKLGVKDKENKSLTLFYRLFAYTKVPKKEHQVQNIKAAVPSDAYKTKAIWLYAYIINWLLRLEQYHSRSAAQRYRSAYIRLQVLIASY